MNTIQITVFDSPVRMNGQKSQAVIRNGAHPALNHQGEVIRNGVNSPVRMNGENTQAITENGVNPALNHGGHENHQGATLHSPANKTTFLSKWRTDWFTWITRLLVVLVIGGSIYFILWLLLPSHSHIALRYSRYYETMATVFMIVSTVLMLYMIYRWHTDLERRPDQNVSRHHVPVTVIAFIVGLASIACIGYATALPAYIALFGNDQALNYTFTYEPAFDIFFIVVFLIFTPILIVFAIGFAPAFCIGEAILNVLGCTLILCILQKWMLETLLVNAHLCEELVEEGRSCINHDERHYILTLDNLTHRESRLYSTLSHNSPLIYTCTMELFPAVWALLVCMVRRRDHISANREYDPAYQPTNCRITICYILLIIALLMKVVLFILQSVFLRFYDDPDKNDNAQLINAIVHLLSYASNTVLFWTIMESWHRIGDHFPLGTKFKIFLKKVSKPWTWTVFDQPDLAILIISGVVTSAVALIRFIVHLVVYSGSSLDAMAIVSIYMSDLANLVMIISFYIQFRLIKKFLLFNEASMKQLAEFQFILHLGPVAIVINLLLFGAIYASKSSFIPPYPTDNLSYDNMLALLESAYPGSYLYLTTAAVCWAHVVERLYKAGAYRIIKDHNEGNCAAGHH